MNGESEEKEMTQSEGLGAVIGLMYGSSKGSGLGLSAALAVAPVLGPLAPLALLLVPVGTALGAYAGVTTGSKGLSRLALSMAAGPVGDALGVGEGIKTSLHIGQNATNNTQ